MFVVLEGTDAAGKDTQAKLLEARINTKTSSQAVVISFPRYETTLGKAIRKHLLNEIAVADVTSLLPVARALVEGSAPPPIRRASEDNLIFQCMQLADKYDAAAIIRRHLRDGVTVIADRWKQSALAYGAVEGLPLDWLYRIQTSLPDPDLSIFIDVSEEESLRRRPELRDRNERDRVKQRAVREQYQELWNPRMVPRSAGYIDGALVKVDGHGSKEEVHERIWTHVMEHL